MRVRTLITVAAVVVAVAGSTAGRSAVADANLYADTLIMQVNQQMAAPVGLREFSFVVKSDRITNRDFKGTLRCSARFDVQRVGDASQPGFVGGYLKVGFYVGFAGTRVSCDGEVAGDTIAGRTRKTSVICRPAREPATLVEATGTQTNAPGTAALRLSPLPLTCSASPAWKLSRTRADAAFQAVTKNIGGQMTNAINKSVAAAFDEAARRTNMPGPS
ncbi:hypothetical protein F4556_000036 [Kitasatospora gansuensis]|uniref:Uncharacterized protein n=1 Tax=Kitasatospora gansuensis TaxID=258050 RepID=A0A7W7S7V8_9ACTN|nr:hypothetical protein [Kitasatospora gansuensis]MBB4944501.1 hypothetical protein [Kitasatospora gansuensis]